MRIFLLLIFFFPFSFVFAEDFQDNYDKKFTTGNIRTMYNDLSKIDFQIIDVKKFFIPKWIDELGDFSDILQIKFNVTNNDLDNFVIYKNMFQIDVVDPNQDFHEVRRTNNDLVVDNYFPQYIEDFKLRFQDILLPSEIFDCTLLNDSVKINQTRTFSVCFDVKQKWSNNPLNLEGPLLYYLVMMDNKFSTSCPNCITANLNNYYQKPTMELMSLKAQIALGIQTEKISCKHGFELIFKNPQNPACVKPLTAKILKNRGWAQ